MVSATVNQAGVTYGTDSERDRSIRIVVDHVRAAVFMLGDEAGIVPSNLGQGYVLRRIIRRAIRHGRKLDIPGEMLRATAESVIECYTEAYPQLDKNGITILNELSREEDRFSAALTKGETELEKMLPRLLERDDKVIPGDVAFRLYDTFGFPLEITEELANEHGLTVDRAIFDQHYTAHQKRSKAGAEKTFKGGLADDSETVQRLHTATHLLHQALRDELGNHVQQKGSNITAERLRFDFSHNTPMSPEQIDHVQSTVNSLIADDLPISVQVMKLQDALDHGAIALFGEKYQENVKVYSIGDFSKEVCGGPHAKRTSELGRFRIIKEQSSSSGVRRIRAVLEANS